MAAQCYPELLVLPLAQSKGHKLPLRERNTRHNACTKQTLLHRTTGTRTETNANKSLNFAETKERLSHGLPSPVYFTSLSLLYLQIYSINPLTLFRNQMDGWFSTIIKVYRSPVGLRFHSVGLDSHAFFFTQGSGGAVFLYINKCRYFLLSIL